MSSGLPVRNVVAQVTAAARTSAIDLGVAGAPVVVVAETEMEPEPDELSECAALPLATRRTTETAPSVIMVWSPRPRTRASCPGRERGAAVLQPLSSTVGYAPKRRWEGPRRFGQVGAWAGGRPPTLHVVRSSSSIGLRAPLSHSQRSGAADPSVTYGRDEPSDGGIERSVTVADWAAFAITFGWAGTAFWVVHVITRVPPSGRPKPPRHD